MIEYPADAVIGQEYGIDARSIVPYSGVFSTAADVPDWMILSLERPDGGEPGTGYIWASGVVPPPPQEWSGVAVEPGWGDRTPFTFNSVEPVLEPVTAEAPTFTDEPPAYTIPEVAGVEYSTAAGPVTAGTYGTDYGGTVTITAAALAGYLLEGDAEWTHDYPLPPDPEPEIPWDLLDEDLDLKRVTTALAPRVLAHVADPDGDLPLAMTHLTTVVEYVRGYTRGRGFSGPVPARDLQAVIIAATGRLYVNPEQLSYFQHGDYSERPAILSGWTLAERAVLNRHRRRSA